MQGPFLTKSVVSIALAILVGLLSECDSLIEIAASNEREKWHHLFGLNKGMILGGLAEDDEHAWVDRLASGRSQFVRVLTEQFFLGSVVDIVSFTDFGKGGVSKAFDFGGIESNRTGTFHRRHHGVENRGDHEDLFLSDAKQVVIEGSSVDDASSCAIEIRGFVHNDGRVAWPCDDGAFPAIEGSSRDGWSAGDANQRNASMFEELLCGLEGGFADQRDQVVDTEICMDRLIESSDPFCSHLLSAGVRVHHDSVSGCDHADRITGDRR